MFFHLGLKTNGFGHFVASIAPIFQGQKSIVKTKFAAAQCAGILAKFIGLTIINWDGQKQAFGSPRLRLGACFKR